MAERHKLLLESPNLQEEKLPRRSAKSSTESGYVLSIASLPSFYAASASAPFNVIDIFDKTTLRGVQTLSGHETATTSLRTAASLAGTIQNCLVSSGKDGSVKAWDERSSTPSITMTNPGKKYPLLCCDVSQNGMTVAAGSDLQGEEAVLVYWDPRKSTTPLRTHTSTHSDDITTVAFGPQNVLLSGSADGLICTSNADEDDEDESTIQVGNWGCSVSQVGWIQGVSDPDSAAIWASSDMETFSTWKSDLDQLLSLDIRSPVLHNGRTWVTDYHITTHSSSTSNPNPAIFTGSNEGDVVLLSNMNLSVPDAPWCLHKIWSHGHTGIVRGLLWDEPNETLVTGGEDGKLNVWPIKPIPVENKEDEEDDDDEDEDDSMVVDSPKPRKRERQADDERRGKKARR
ncbi:WD40 repeat-like protein [Agrocybe pediades]|nr:WD40 repeat-like protein [Agrocybe pediades]